MSCTLANQLIDLYSDGHYQNLQQSIVKVRIFLIFVSGCLLWSLNSWMAFRVKNAPIKWSLFGHGSSKGCPLIWQSGWIPKRCQLGAGRNDTIYHTHQLQTQLGAGRDDTIYRTHTPASNLMQARLMGPVWKSIQESPRPTRSNNEPPRFSSNGSFQFYEDFPRFSRFLKIDMI